MENTSGQGKGSAIPPEIKKWNWGAFFLCWIWGLGNNVFIALLALIPGLNLIMSIILGIKGNEWAWQNKYWDSIDDFKRIQRRWAWWGLGIFLFLVLLSFLVVISSTPAESPQIKTLF